MQNYLKYFDELNPSSLLEERKIGQKFSKEKIDELILHVENTTYTKLPNDYREFISKYVNGAYLNDAHIEVVYKKTGEKNKIPITEFFGLNFSDDSSFSIIEWYDTLQGEEEISGYIPFASSEIGILFIIVIYSNHYDIVISDPYFTAFDYDKNYDKFVHFVTNSFSDLINNIKIIS